MKKTTFITMVLTTISIIFLFFALGMCMALIPEWHAFRQGIVFGVIGLVLGLVTIIVYRKMTNKTPIEISGRMILTVIAGILGTLIFGCGMCFTMIWNNMILGIILGLVGIIILLMLIPLVKGIED